MGRFLVRRGLQAVATVLFATLVVHVAITILPGDPVRALFGFRRPPPEVVTRIRAQYHLDDPYVVQYWLFLSDMLTLDLGQSLRGGQVNAMVAAAWMPTATLVSVALVVQAVLGLAGGVLATIHTGTWTSRSILALASVMIAVPVTLSAPLLHHVLTVRLGLLPINASAGGWAALVLPVLVLAAVTLGTVVVFLRSELRQTLRAPFVRFATATGLRRRRVVGVHALRVALPPVIGYMASNLGIIVVSVLVVEDILGVPGLGQLLINAIEFQDRSTVVAVVMLVTIVVVVLGTLADIVVAALDPRVRRGSVGGAA